MQHNVMISNISTLFQFNTEENKWEKVEKMTGAENGGSWFFLTLAESTKDGTQHIPFRGLLPEKLSLEVGQLVSLDFLIKTETVNQISTTTNIVRRIEVGLYSKKAETEQISQVAEEKAQVMSEAQSA